MHHPSCVHPSSPHVPRKETVLALQVRVGAGPGGKEQEWARWERGKGGLNRAGRTLVAQGGPVGRAVQGCSRKLSL